MAEETDLPFDPRTITAAELQELLHASKITSVRLVEIYLEQIEKYNGYLHAVICTAPRDDLLQRARHLDAQRSEGKVLSALHGIPILVKDNIDTHPDLGMGTTCGSLALVGSRPKKNADLVERLIAGGALILGKANLSEMSYYKGNLLLCGWSAVGGQTQSAYVRGGLQDDETYAGHSTTSGSSSGSAVAVSAGLAPVSIGTETMGSLVSPSSRAALYTIKPTIGLVSQEGIVPISVHCDSAGPMTKTSLDLANLLDVIVDPTKTQIPEGGYTSVLTNSWADIRVGVLDPALWSYGEGVTKVEPEVDKQQHRAYQDAYAKIAKAAKSFKKYIPLPAEAAFKMEDGRNCTWSLWTGTFEGSMNSYLDALEYSKVRTLAELVEFNYKHAAKALPLRYPDQERLEKAMNNTSTQEERDTYLEHCRRVGRTEGIDKMLKDYNIDVIIGPADGAIPTVAAASGYPIASLPLGYLDDLNGRPFGMAALASGHQEDVLIKAQSAWEATFPPRKPPPYENFTPKS